MKIFCLFLTIIIISLTDISPVYSLPEYLKGYAPNIRSSVAPVLISKNLTLAKFSLPPDFNSKLELINNTSIIHSGITGVGTRACKNILFYNQYAAKFNLPEDYSLNTLGLWFYKKFDHDLLINFCPY